MLRRSSIQRTGFKPRSSATRFSSFSQVKGKKKIQGDYERIADGQGKARSAASSLNGGARKPLNKVGPRTRKWRAAWAFLKPRLEAAGRVQCEFPHVPHVCKGPLDPAHSKKRNEMRGTDLYAVAIACRCVHNILDYRMSHEAMEAAVMEAIERGGGMILPDKLKKNYRRCEVCDEPLTDTDKYSIHDKCADVLRKALKEPVVRIL